MLNECESMCVGRVFGSGGKTEVTVFGKKLFLFVVIAIDGPVTSSRGERVEQTMSRVA